MICSPKAADIIVINTETGKEISFQKRQLLIDVLWKAARYLEQCGVENLLNPVDAKKADELLQSFTFTQCPNVKFQLRLELMEEK